MNAEGLLAHYARIADAPDAIERVRLFVLDLAVRGKLVAQDAGEKPAIQLLVKINQAKEARIASGDLRKPRELVRDDKVDQPFSVPDTWKWIRLDEVGAIVGGGTPSASDLDNFAEPGQGIPWLTPADLGGFKDLYISTGSRDLSEKGARSSSATVMPQGTVLFTSRAPIGYVAITKNPLATNQGFKSVVPYVEECSRFIALVLKTFAPEIDAKAPGTTFKEVSGKIVASISFPLAPLAEQHRIVAKVDELMALCDQLEAARAQREATRNRLAAASLARLNAPDPDTFRADARFALDALPALTTRPDQIKQLRQTILNLAVRGKLVLQNPKERLNSKTQQLAQEPFQCPIGWTWTTVQGLTDQDRDISYGVIKLGQEPKEGGIDVLRCSDVKPGHINLSNVRKVHTDIEGAYTRTRLVGGEVLINIRGTLGGVALVPDTLRGFNVAREVAVVPVSSNVCGQFIVYFMLSPFFWETIQANLRGIAYKGLNLGTLRDFPVPLPPLAEQHRIVAKVDELMALCDHMEASLTTGEATRSRVLDALLHEALAPVATPSSEHPRAAISSYVISRLAAKRHFGRTAHMKYLFLAEARLGLNLGGHYMREAAGPLDTGIYELEKQAEATGWYSHSVETLASGNEKVSYKPGKALSAITKEGITVLGPSRAEMDRLIDLMGGLKTEQVEIIATLFAAWNDALLDGHAPDDDWIIREVREHWHVSKQRFTPADLHKWLGWMRQNDVVPLGHPPRTMQQTTMEF